MSFFENFPIVNYDDKLVRNITLNARIVEDVFKRVEVYHPYVLEDWERPDTVAADYYKDSSYWWVVLYSNRIIDPYYEWPLSWRDLMSFIAKKYGTTVDQTKTRVLYYRYTGLDSDTQEVINRKSWLMPKETYDSLTGEESSGWTAVYAYDFEVNANEQRRRIRLMDRSYIPQVERELGRIFNG